MQGRSEVEGGGWKAEGGGRERGAGGRGRSGGERENEREKIKGQTETDW